MNSTVCMCCLLRTQPTNHGAAICFASVHMAWPQDLVKMWGNIENSSPAAGDGQLPPGLEKSNHVGGLLDYLRTEAGPKPKVVMLNQRNSTHSQTPDKWELSSGESAGASVNSRQVENKAISLKADSSQNKNDPPQKGRQQNTQKKVAQLNSLPNP